MNRWNLHIAGGSQEEARGRALSALGDSRFKAAHEEGMLVRNEVGSPGR